MKLSDGKYRLPIKWAAKSENGMYGPTHVAFNAGVQIVGQRKNKYVPLIWADEIDTVAVMKLIEEKKVITRSGENRAAMAITILADLPYQLTADSICGRIPFTFSGPSCQVDKKDFLAINTTNGYNLNMDGVRTLYVGSDKDFTLDFSWNGGTPSVENFMGHVRLLSSNIIKYAYFQWNVPEDKYWEFQEAIPDSLSVLPATGASVVSVVRTNRPWSMIYRHEDGVRDTVSSIKNATEVQSLYMGIPDNTDLTSKNILVDIYSENELMLTLRYTQSAASGSFAVDSIVPAPNSELEAGAQIITAYVTTTMDWWISYEGTKYNFLASDSSGEVSIPANPNPNNRSIVITVGYGTTLVNTYTYTQKFSEELTYVDNDMPTFIPVGGGSYTFTFSGSYQGNLQVRAMLGTEILVTGSTTTNRLPTLTIPNNYSSLNTRELTFEYKKGNNPWTAFDTPETRTQEAAQITPAVLPTASIPREGGAVSGLFTGTYTGTVDMAVREGDILVVSGTGNTPGSVNLVIPALTGNSDRELTFYYKAGNMDWTPMGSRIQVAGTLTFGSVTPAGNIPADGGTYSCSASGTYPGNVTLRARTGTDTTLATQTSTVPVIFSLNIPVNPDTSERTVVFEYSKDGISWITVDTRIQTNDIKIDGGDNEVEDFENGGTINGGKEL